MPDMRTALAPCPTRRRELYTPSPGQKPGNEVACSATPACTHRPIRASSPGNAAASPGEPDELVQDVLLQRAAGRPEPEQRGEPEAISRQAYDRGPHGIDAVPLDRLLPGLETRAQRLEAAGVGGGCQEEASPCLTGVRQVGVARRGPHGCALSPHRGAGPPPWLGILRRPLRVALAGLEETREERLDQGLFRCEMV